MNILLIQLKRIGDLVLTTPAIAALREKFPTAKLTLVIARECGALLPAIKDVDQALIMHRGLGDVSALFAVTRRKFDYCIDFTRNDRSAFLTFLSRAEKRIVSYRVKRRSWIRRHFYNEFVEHRMRDMHTIDYNLSLLEPLGIHDAAPTLHLDLPGSSREKADALRRQVKIDNPFVILHPGSARGEKFWTSESWAQVIEHARTGLRFNCILTGGSTQLEQAHIARIKAKLSRPNLDASQSEAATGSIVDLSGQTDLLTLAALIAQARFLVTVDSAPMHLAAATRTPQIILFGPTNPFHWRPRESPAVILQGESPEPLSEFVSKQPRLPMKLISTETVINAMDSLLSAPAAQAL
ncbi:MAG: glycosyltransferase family 9 protein [Verrucomicrobiota bacterium]|nr:glycosyltransferase family 9 protein [Verrucomicrobiota bacterium]